MMTSRDILALYTELEGLGVRIWIDGGWAVDALLGEQTRPHDDLDVVLEQKDVRKTREILEAQGYGDVPRDDTSDWNFVLGGDRDRKVDIHVVVFDNKGNGLYGPVEKGVMYPAASLTGTGTIDGHAVRCISAECMVNFLAPWLHQHPDKYLKAISALCDRFGIKHPEAYERFKKQNEIPNA